MPSGLKRLQKAEALHFITFSCFHRLPPLEAPGAKETVEAVLEQTRARHQARVYAYVLMPEHVHLLVNEPPRIVLAQWLKTFKQIASARGAPMHFSSPFHHYSGCPILDALFAARVGLTKSPVKTHPRKILP